MTFTVSINPSFHCNFRCSHCYLSKDQLSDRTRLDLDLLKIQLNEISNSFEISHIDLYGGEIGILPIEYLLKLDSILRKYTDSINVITNLRIINPYFLKKDVSISVSYDFEFRQDSLIVFDNIQKLNKPVSVLTLAIPEILHKDPIEMISFLNLSTNIQSWEIKKYSSNFSNDLNIPQLKFEAFIELLLSKINLMNYKFINKEQIESCLNSTYISNSSNHIYITPKNTFAVLDFANNLEFFNELASFDQYKKWVLKEQELISNNVYCKACKYYDKINKVSRCYTEHVRVPVKDPNVFSCDGSLKLLSKLEQSF